MVDNAIVLENEKPGTPESVWMVDGAGSDNIQGFTTQASVNLGDTVDFKIDTDSANYRIDIYRIGYYGGDGARLVDTVQHQSSTPIVQPAPLTDPSTGLVDAGNWSVTDSWHVPTDLVSGVYAANLIREDGTPGESQILFVVKNDGSTSDIVYQTADETWHAYNPAVGDNFYGGGDFALSYNAPVTTNGADAATGNGPWTYFYGAEYAAIRFMEKNGYDVTYQSGIDTSVNGNLLLNHKVFMDAGHDEYWTAEQHANVEAARDAGVNLMFLSGNDVFWTTRLANSIDGSATPDRTLISYKTALDESDPTAIAAHPVDPSGIWTGAFRDPAQPGGANPENALTGNLYMVDYDHNQPVNYITVPSDYADLRFWANTAVANLQPGQVYQTAGQYLGYEWNVDLDNGFRPAGLTDLSSTWVNTSALVTPDALVNGNAQHSLTLYRAQSGALVFGAGSIAFAWALDDHHAYGPPSTAQPDGTAIGTPTDPNIQQAMVNLLADMGVQPGSLSPWLVAATQSTDHVKPVSSITSPYIESLFGLYNEVNGIATDSGGGVVAGVEVSIDGGATWHPAMTAVDANTGATKWDYVWANSGTQNTYSVLSRAVDDSLNLETLHSPAQLVSADNPTLDNFGLAQGWGAPVFERIAADINHDGKVDYVGFGGSQVFVAYGGEWTSASGQTGSGFGDFTALVNDFGSAQGYTQFAQRGTATTELGAGQSLYAQGFSGIYWVGVSGTTTKTDDAGHAYDAYSYGTLQQYENFGTQQGWSDHNGFDITFLSHTQSYASVLGFGNEGVVVAPQAFQPNATAAESYTIPIAVGNNAGWDQTHDVRSFVDSDGNPIDLNHDGTVDFVGMGPAGLVYAYGAIDQTGNFTLGSLQTAHINGVNSDLGRAQGWTDETSPRFIVKDAATGFYDIIGFGSDGVHVAQGQDPATHGGEAFGQMHLAMANFGTAQGWTSATPREVADVNHDGIPDIVGFGGGSTFVALGQTTPDGTLTFQMDWDHSIPNLGISQGWDSTTVRTVANSGGDAVLVLSGGSGTHVWDLNA